MMKALMAVKQPEVAGRSAVVPASPNTPLGKSNAEYDKYESFLVT